MSMMASSESPGSLTLADMEKRSTIIQQDIYLIQFRSSHTVALRCSQVRPSSSQCRILPASLSQSHQFTESYYDGESSLLGPANWHGHKPRTPPQSPHSYSYACLSPKHQTPCNTIPHPSFIFPQAPLTPLVLGSSSATPARIENCPPASAAIIFLPRMAELSIRVGVWMSSMVPWPVW